MTREIMEIITADASAAASSVNVNGRSFLLANESDSETLYFRDCTADAEDATATNGFPIAAGETLPFVLRGGTVSFYGAKAKLLIVGEV